jgi:hypothetical protein
MKTCGLEIPKAPHGGHCARLRGHPGECRGIGPDDTVYVHFFPKAEAGPPEFNETERVQNGRRLPRQGAR